FPPSVTSLGIQPAANDRKKSHRLVGQGAMPTEEPQRLHLFLLRGARTSQGPALRWLKNTKPVNLIWLVPAKEERSPQGLHPRVVVLTSAQTPQQRCLGACFGGRTPELFSL